jgi:hypothetical protein
MKHEYPLTPALSPSGEGILPFPLPSGERIKVRGGLRMVQKLDSKLDILVRRVI